MPHRNIDLAANSFGHLAPVHVPARLLHGPHDLAQASDSAADVGQSDGASLCDERVSPCLLQELNERRVRLIVGDQDGSEAVEGTSKQHSKKVEAVWQIHGDSLGVVLLEMLPNNGNLLGDASNAVFRDVFLAQDGQDGSSTV